MRNLRYYLRRALASQARRVSTRFPEWHALDEVATRLSFVRSVYGPYLLNTPGDRTFELCVRGYGPFTSAAIQGLDRRFVFLDIGANLGLFSLLAVRNPYCERVVAVEPLPDVFKNLERNISRNRADKIQAVWGAVSATPDASVYLSFDARHSGMSRVVERGAATVCAPVVSGEKIDTLFPELPETLVAKIDVEGSEIDVLRTLRRTRVYGALTELFIEVSERNLGSARRVKLLRMLAEDGFRELSRAGPPHHYDARYRRTPRRG
jgi:FkbM family methyltransferase